MAGFLRFDGPLMDVMYAHRPGVYDFLDLERKKGVFDSDFRCSSSQFVSLVPWLSLLFVVHGLGMDVCGGWCGVYARFRYVVCPRVTKPPESAARIDKAIVFEIRNGPKPCSTDAFSKHIPLLSKKSSDGPGCGEDVEGLKASPWQPLRFSEISRRHLRETPGEFEAKKRRRSSSSTSSMARTDSGSGADAARIPTTLPPPYTWTGTRAGQLRYI
jgi:hypothetical protein